MSVNLDDLLADLTRQIAAGTLPWRRPWRLCADPSLPLRADGQPFSGSNAWTLAYLGAVKGYASPYWLTFAQAVKLGAPVRKGERASPAVLYKVTLADPEPDAPSDAGKVKRFLKPYGVFNAEQLTEPPAAYLALPPVDPGIRDAARVTALEAIPAKVELVGQQAVYLPGPDLIRLPPPELFSDLAEFHATWAHELAHWTGHPDRLARSFGRFGDQAYAFEELVAELSAILLGLRLGLPPVPLESHASYLAHWSEILHARPRALLEASGHAQRAVDLLLSFAQGAAGTGFETALGKSA